MGLRVTGIYFIYRENLELYGLKMNTDCKNCQFGLDDEGCARMFFAGSRDCFVPMGCLAIDEEVEL